MSDTNIELITQARTEKNEVLPYELLEEALINRWLPELGAHCLVAPAYQLPHHLGAGEKHRLLAPPSLSATSGSSCARGLQGTASVLPFGEQSVPAGASGQLVGGEGKQVRSASCLLGLRAARGLGG